MSAKMLSSFSDDNRKQIGCINIYKLFNRSNFPTGQRGSHSHKRLLLPPVENHDAGRVSTESSGSLVNNARLSQEDIFSLRKTNSGNQSQPTYTMEKQKSCVQSSPDIRDIAKDLMHREARSLSIKSRKNNDEKGVTLMKYTDSPRPLPAKTKVPERLALPRSSYDERESRVMMKIKEPPRFSLDSRASATEVSSLHLQMENENHIKQHQSSIIAKLMGLEPFPDTTIAKHEIKITTGKASENQKMSPASQKHFASSLRSKKGDSLIKPTAHLKVTVEQAPLRQRDCGQGSPKMVSWSRKPLANVSHESSSVYGEIQKRITEIEFRGSNKDLRALKQILDSMQKTKQRLDNESGDYGKLRQRRHGTEIRCLNQKPDLSIWQNRFQQDPAERRTRFQKPLNSPATKMNSNLSEKMIVSSSIHVSAMVDLQRDTMQNLKYQRENKPACNKKAKGLIPRNNEKSTRRNLERDQVSRLPELKKEKGVKSGRTSPHQNPPKVQREFSLTSPSLNLANHQKYHSKNVSEKPIWRSKIMHSKSHNLQSSYEQLSEHSTDTRYSSNQGDTASVKSEGYNSEVSQMETEVTSFLPNSIITSSREQQNCLRSLADSLPSVELGTNIMDQPSPVSVLDNTFYNEDAPSPVAKISTAFQEDDTIGPEDGWYTENPVHVIASTNRLENLSLDRGQRYINEELLFSRQLKDTFIGRTSDQVPCSWLLNDSKTSKDHEGREDSIKAGKWKFTEKKDKKNLSQQNKIVLDMENEILIRKITMGGLFTSGRKNTSLQTIMKEVGIEIGHRCSMPYWNVDDEDDGMIKLLTADLKYQSEDWMDFGGEVPYLVLDIERQVFKDLINEVVTGELLGLHDSLKRTWKQHFGK